MRIIGFQPINKTISFSNIIYVNLHSKLWKFHNTNVFRKNQINNRLNYTLTYETLLIQLQILLLTIKFRKKKIFLS